MITPTSPGGDAGLGRDRAQCGEHALFRRVRRGQDLRCKPALADFQRHVGERAADIDAEADCGGGCHACALKPLSGNDSNVIDVSGQSGPRADFIADDAF
jgi:sorbitol-specific phosphotransferase system component IIBC